MLVRLLFTPPRTDTSIINIAYVVDLSLKRHRDKNKNKQVINILRIEKNYMKIIEVHKFKV